MPLELFLRGVAIGFAVAFALGPIGLLVIRRTIERGWRYGFLSGTGVATADATYAAIAAFGLTAVSELLVGIDRWLGILGGVVLLVLAVRALRAATSIGRPGDPDAFSGVSDATEGSGAAGMEVGARGGPLVAWATMVGLTLANPATILSFAALFASIGAGTGGAAGATAVTAGVFLGSVAWWALLTGIVAGVRARMTPSVVRWLNVASALVIGGFGLVAIGIGLLG
jgi:threonine/homoserine/homoserine lactone efflux protein